MDIYILKKVTVGTSMDTQKIDRIPKKLLYVDASAGPVAAMIRNLRVHFKQSTVGIAIEVIVVLIQILNCMGPKGSQIATSLEEPEVFLENYNPHGSVGFTSSVVENLDRTLLVTLEFVTDNVDESVRIFNEFNLKLIKKQNDNVDKFVESAARQFSHLSIHKTELESRVDEFRSRYPSENIIFFRGIKKLDFRASIHVPRKLKHEASIAFHGLDVEIRPELVSRDTSPSVHK